MQGRGPCRRGIQANATPLLCKVGASPPTITHNHTQKPNAMTLITTHAIERAPFYALRRNDSLYLSAELDGTFVPLQDGDGGSIWTSSINTRSRPHVWAEWVKEGSLNVDMTQCQPVMVIRKTVVEVHTVNPTRTS